MRFRTGTNHTAAQPTPDDQPLFRDGPTAAQLADPTSLWHIGDILHRHGVLVPARALRELYVELAGDPFRYFELSGRWDEQVKTSGPGFYMTRAREDAGLPVGTWDRPTRDQTWPSEVRDNGLSYYVHDALRNLARHRLSNTAAVASAQDVFDEQHRCQCCGQTDHAATMTEPAPGHRLTLCPPCAPVVAAVLTERLAAESVDGKTRRAAADALVNALHVTG